MTLFTAYKRPRRKALVAALGLCILAGLAPGDRAIARGVGSLPPRPDLRVTGFQYDPVRQDTLWITVANTGSAASQPCAMRVTLYLPYPGGRASSTNLPIHREVSVPGMTSGQLFLVPVFVQYRDLNPLAGLGAEVDAYNTVIESNETNNVFGF